MWWTRTQLIPYEAVDLDDGDWKPVYVPPVWATTLEEARRIADRRGVTLRCDLPVCSED